MDLIIHKIKKYNHKLLASKYNSKTHKQREYISHQTKYLKDMLKEVLAQRGGGRLAGLAVAMGNASTLIETKYSEKKDEVDRLTTNLGALNRNIADLQSELTRKNLEATNLGDQLDAKDKEIEALKTKQAKDILDLMTRQHIDQELAVQTISNKYDKELAETYSDVMKIIRTLYITAVSLGVGNEFKDSLEDKMKPLMVENDDDFTRELKTYVDQQIADIKALLATTSPATPPTPVIPLTPVIPITPITPISSSGSSGDTPPGIVSPGDATP